MTLRSKLDQSRAELQADGGRHSPTFHPYYVVAPPFQRTSAGIKVLHLLCDALNHLGCEAYMVIQPAGPAGWIISPDLNTPLLTKEIDAQHFRERRTPIMIYPEVTKGNPFAAPVVCRYVLNYPGLLGGDSVFDPGELIYGYSHRLAEAAGAHGKVLFLPASDPDIFHPPAVEGERSGACFYASKYKEYHGAELFSVTEGAFEITRDKPGSLDPNEIADLFRRSKVFYCYENTSLATEAAMCGCPAVFLPNEHLTEIIASEELGVDGFAWGDAPEEIARAQATVAGFYEHYLAVLETFGSQLTLFVQDTQARAAEAAFVSPLNFKGYSPVIFPRNSSNLVHAAHLVCTVGLSAMLMRASRYALNRLRPRPSGQGAPRPPRGPTG